MPIEPRAPPPVVLAIATALPVAEIGLLLGDAPLGILRLESGPGLAGKLPEAVRALLAEHGRAPALIAALLGPGGFTGLRAGLSLAHGLALGFGCDLAGATVGEALAAELAAPADAPPLWVATASRGDTVFLERDGAQHRLALDAVDPPATPIRLGGDAAAALAARLAGSGARIALVAPSVPGAVGVARAGLARHRGALAPARPVLPLYVEPPGTSRPAAPSRPPPRH